MVGGSCRTVPRPCQAGSVTKKPDSNSWVMMIAPVGLWCPAASRVLAASNQESESPGSARRDLVHAVYQRQRASVGHSRNGVPFTASVNVSAVGSLDVVRQLL